MKTVKLSVCVLGAFDINIQGREEISELQLDAGKQKLLLTYLLTEIDESHLFSDVAAIFWPDLLPEAAADKLNHALTKINELGHQAEIDGDLVWRNENDLICIATSKFEIDSHQFRSLLKQSQHQRDDTDPSTFSTLTISRMEHAGSLYRGQFLDGTSAAYSLRLREWLVIQREHHRYLIVRTLDQLTDHYMAHGKYQEAGTYAHRYLQIEPWQEAAHRRLMTILARQGRYYEAMAQYQRCQDTLNQAFRVPPAAETTALYEQIRRLEKSPPRYHVPEREPSAIGRMAELRHIQRSLANANTRIVTIAGVDGIGKTTLAQMLLPSQKSQFLDGVAYIDFQSQHHSLLISSIAAAVGMVLKANYSHMQQLVAFLRKREMLIVLDHFAPQAQDVVTQLAQHLIDNTKAIKLIVCGKEPLSLSDEVAVPLEGLAFPPFSGSEETYSNYDAVRLFEQRANINPQLIADEENRHLISNQIAQTTQLMIGIPLAIELAAGIITSANIAADYLAQINSHIDARIKTLQTSANTFVTAADRITIICEIVWHLLTPTQQTALARLSLFTGGFDLNAAEAVIGASDARQDVNALVKAGLIFQSQAQRYDMHGAIRHFAQTQLELDPQGADIKLAYLEYFAAALPHAAKEIAPASAEELICGDADFANIHQVWHRAVNEKRFDILESAIDGFVNWHAYRQRFGAAAQALATAETFLNQAPTSLEDNLQRRHVLAHVLVARSTFLRLSGDMLNARLTAESGLRVARALSLDTVIGKGLSELGLHELHHGKLGQALIFMQNALAFQDDKLITQRIIATLTGYRGAYRESQLQMLDVIADTTRYESPFLTAQALNAYGELMVQTGDYEELENMMRGNVTRLSQIHHPPTLCEALRLLGITCYGLGRAVEARHHLQAALTIATELGWAEAMSRINAQLGDIARDRGRFARALELYQHAKRDAVSHLQQARVLAKLGYMALANNDTDQAREWYQSGLHIVRESGYLALAPQYVYGFAMLQVTAGDLENALKLLALVRQDNMTSFELRRHTDEVWRDLTPSMPKVIAENAQRWANRQDLWRAITEQALTFQPAQLPNLATYQSSQLPTKS